MSTIFIGMPVYNGERFLRQALNSLLNQTYTDWILYISDDASTDTTATICQEYMAKDSRIIYTKQSVNLGLFANFGYTLQACTAPYFMWAAQDDIREPNYLELCMKEFAQNPQLGLATTCSAGVDSYGRVVVTEKELVRFSGKPSIMQVAQYILHPEILGKCNLMYGLFTTKAAKETWKAYPQRNVWGQDYMFALAAISRFSVSVLPDILFKKRFGGYSNPRGLDTDDPATVHAFEIKHPKNHIFPFGRFRQYLVGHLEALRGTPYQLLALLLYIRLPRAFLLYIKDRNYKRFFAKLLGKKSSK